MELAPYVGQADAGERLVFGEVTVVIRIPSEATGGAFALLEEPSPMVDTPTHTHEREDELWYVLEGEHIFQVGEQERRVGPGGFVFAPRGIPHSQRRAIPGVGRELVLVVPGGFEGFFRDLAAADKAGTLESEAYTVASERYGITWG